MMGIGTNKMKKDIVGALKKGIAEGDIAGMIQGLLDGFTRYIDMSGMEKPWEMAFKPFSIMISAIGSQAAGIVASSQAFADMIEWIASPEGQQAITDFAADLASAMERFGMMDLDTLMDFIEFIVDEVTKIADFVKGARDFWPGFQQAIGVGVGQGTLGGSSGGGINPSGGGIKPSGGGSSNTITVNTGGVVTNAQVSRIINTLQQMASTWRL
jgi:hypothetical protein